ECSWLDIGKILHTHFEGDQDGLNIWISYTEQYSTKLDKNNIKIICNDYYNYFEAFSGLTYKTIQYYANIDNLPCFDLFIRDYRSYIMSNCLNQSEYYLAILNFMSHRHEFIWTGSGWYYFNGYFLDFDKTDAVFSQRAISKLL